jgi:acetyl esterase/lipase
MSQDARPSDISKMEVVYRIPGMDDVKVRRDVEYAATEAGALTMDVYYPPGSDAEARTPAVVFVAGYPDPGFERIVGCKLKEMASYVSWARLMAASGLVAITYTNREPAADVDALLRHLVENAGELRIDADRVGLWACSGNVPNALSVLMRGGERLKCAALCYGLTLDTGGNARVAEAARQWGFVNPCEGRSVADLPSDVPLFVVRAGRDEMPHLNETIDRFTAEALRLNLPLTLVNHPAAPHAFDLFDDGQLSREIIRQVLAFMRFHLLEACVENPTV